MLCKRADHVGRLVQPEGGGPATLRPQAPAPICWGIVASQTAIRVPAGVALRFRRARISVKEHVSGSMLGMMRARSKLCRERPRAAFRNPPFIDDHSCLGACFHFWRLGIFPSPAGAPFSPISRRRRIVSAIGGVSGCVAAHRESLFRSSGASRSDVTGSRPVAGRPGLRFGITFSLDLFMV